MQQSQDGPLYILRGHRLQFLKNIVFLSLKKINFLWADSADPDEKTHYAALQLGHHCLQK